MKYFTFKNNDVVNQFRTAHPSCSFFVNNKRVFISNISNSSASLGSNINSVPAGFLSLYELNVDRPAASLIYPFVEKGSSLNSLSTVSLSTFNAFAYGDTITGSYPLSASISRHYYTGSSRPFISALKNTCNRISYLSNNYLFSSSLGDKAAQNIALIDIPSIFVGAKVNKKSTVLEFYVTGTLTGKLKENSKGELVQLLPTGANSGSIAGVVIRDLGAVLLTGSWDVTTANIDNYDQSGGTEEPFKWYYFMAGIQGNEDYTSTSLPSSSYQLHFEGTSDINTKIMFCTAPRGELNHSSNPTFLDKSTFSNFSFNGKSFIEPKRTIKNIASASYQTPDAPFEKVTYISKIGIYDEERNLLGVASLSRPIKKTEARDLTFKLKLDL